MRKALILASILTLTLAVRGAPPAGEPLAAATPIPADTEFRLDSPPVLQNPTADSMTVVWAVTRRGTGWVEYGEARNLGNRANNSRYGLQQIEDRVLSVRLEGLKPGTTYYYRIGAAQVDYHPNRTIRRGPDMFSEIYSFTTLSDTAKEVSFAVMNDTHEKAETLKLLFAALERDPVDFTLWNGDLVGSAETIEQMVDQLLRPVGAAYAARKPVIFVPGNHDKRGAAARAGETARFFPSWNNGPLGYNFVLRQGPLAIIGLDTGEDKEDDHVYLAGTTDFAAYRLAQRAWLEKAVQSEAFRTAPCKVAVCHIPLYGAWSSALAREQWGGILNQAGVQLLICGHDHAWRLDAPAADHALAQMVGGGPSAREATLIRVHATAAGLTARMLDLEGKERLVWRKTADPASK